VEEAAVVSSTVEYGETLISSVEKDNILPRSFIPKTSQHAG
jgi:imidazoleglycerol phosphate synthase glutamine amidotransferase subunit HisH